jgi:hypothetical protein
MKWVYFLSGIALFIKMLLVANPIMELSQQSSIVELVVQDSGVSNAVSGIILRNRLYDTIFEVVVFTIAILGASFMLANEQSVLRHISVYRSTIDYFGAIGSDDCGVGGYRTSNSRAFKSRRWFCSGCSGGNCDRLGGDYLITAVDARNLPAVARGDFGESFGTCFHCIVRYHSVRI